MVAFCGWGSLRTQCFSSLSLVYYENHDGIGHNMLYSRMSSATREIIDLDLILDDASQ